MTSFAKRSMAELTLADLSPQPALYESSRGMMDVLVGEDIAYALIQASSTGDTEGLQNLLLQPEWIKTAMESQHAVYYVNQSPREGDLREVMAMPYSNLLRAVFLAAEHDHPAAVSVLLKFASQQRIKPSSVIERETLSRTLQRGRAEVLDAMASADRTVVNRHIHHGHMALDMAVESYRTATVAVLLAHGADPSPDVITYRSGRTYSSSILSLSVMVSPGTRMTELLLEHGVQVARSGALHYAVEFARLDHMRLLIQHGADVNEQLTAEMLPRYHHDHYVGRTPLHLAASRGRVKAMQLLESNGARSDVVDVNGKTPAQLLEETDGKTPAQLRAERR